MKTHVIICLPLCKEVKISCCNIITLTGGNFMAGVNISQLYFQPMAVVISYTGLNCISIVLVNVLAS